MAEDLEEGRVPNAAQPRILDIVILGGEWRGGEQWFVWRKGGKGAGNEESTGGLATGASDRPRDKYSINIPRRRELPKGIPTCLHAGTQGLRYCARCGEWQIPYIYTLYPRTFRTFANLKIGNCFRGRC